MFHRVVRLILNEKRDMKVCNLVTSAGRPHSVIFEQLSCSLMHNEETQQRCSLEGHWNVMPVTYTLCRWEIVERPRQNNDALRHFCKKVQYNTDLSIPPATGNVIVCYYSQLLSSPTVNRHNDRIGLVSLLNYNQVMHNYISQYFLYIMFTPIHFDTSVSSLGSFKSCTL